MTGVVGIVVVAAVIGSLWGLLDALFLPAARFQAARASKWRWVAAFVALTALLALSRIGIAGIHAPYRLKDIVAFLFLVTSVSAVACASWYLWTVRRRVSV